MEVNLISESDEREDGEILDEDDEFDEISDYSIPSCGKSDSSQDLLRAISLSSISGSGGEEQENRKKKHYLPPCKRRKKHHEHHHKSKRKKDEAFSRHTHHAKRRRNGSSSSDDSDMEKLDRRTLRQLKEAVRINKSGEVHTNSLRSRLKAMIDHESDDEEIDTLRTLALLTSKQTETSVNKSDINVSNDDDNNSLIAPPISDTIYDKELEDLRLEALKSAVIKKHFERKKRKEMLINNISSDNLVTTDINKENTESFDNISNIPKIDESIPKTDLQEHKSETIIDEDVDIMRAMLLASMSTKITSIPPKPVDTKKVVATKKTPLISNHSINKKLKPNLQTKINLRVKQNSVQKLPFIVKPLIISVNNGSETESDSDKNQPKPINNVPIDESVTEFLRKQREQFEAKQVIIQAKPPVIEEKKESILDKSVVKLLSKSQQKEYRYLQQKLLAANTKRKIRRLSLKLRNSKEELAMHSEEKRNPSDLKKTLLELQTQENGRLQMKGKYRDLAPLLQKVNEASNKRKLCEATIKRLLEDIRLARNDLSLAHDNFTDLVQELINAKNSIDHGLIKNAMKKINIAIPQTSTPLKSNAKNLENKINSEDSIDIKQHIPIDNATILNGYKNDLEIDKIDTNHVNDLKIANDLEKAKNLNDLKIAKEKLHEVINERELIDLEDIYKDDEDMKIISVQETGSCMSKYVSPLDNRSKSTSNPLQMLCPYELFGVCKDEDCKFNHCPA